MTLPPVLLEGYANFRAGRYASEAERYRKLGEGAQRPKVMIIACCDSRAAPETVFDAGPGEIFVVRNVANLVPPYTPDGAQRAVSAALEFAVQALKVKYIVVLGHAQCGGIRAFAKDVEPLSPGDFIGHWMKLIEPAATMLGPRGDRPLNGYLAALEQASAVKTLDNLMTFPYVRNQVERGLLALHAAYFGVASGDLSVYQPERGTFVRIAADMHAQAFDTPRF
jgi:carbonic anhydrase